MVNDGTANSSALTSTVNVSAVNEAPTLTTTAFVQLGADIDGEAIEDLSGVSVAMSNDGSRLVIGAPFNDGNGATNGHVRVYDWNDSAWQQVGSDISGDAAGDISGWSVEMSNDGNRLVIGAPYNDGNGAYSGHVRVYDWNGSAWQQVGTDIDGEAAFDYSGSSVAMSNDGSRLVIGAPYNDGNGADSGHVRVYDWNGNAWQQVGSDISGEAVVDYSAHAVAMSADGNRLIISGIENDGNGVNSGHVRVYDWSGFDWQQVGADIDGEAEGDLFSSAVAISSDGSRIAVSAQKNDGGGVDSGHVRIYDWSNGAWQQVGGDIDGEIADDQSGWSLSLSNDGGRLVIGAPYNDGNGTDSGHVRVYDWNGSVWQQVGLDIDGEAAGDESGYSVAMSGDGSRLVIGAPYNDGNGTDSGHVRVYQFQSNGCCLYIM